MAERLNVQMETISLQMSQVEPNRDSLRCYHDINMPYMPALNSASVLRTQQGLPTFTPDGNPLVGAVRGLAGLFVAGGCCATGIALSAVIGRLVAELLGGAKPFVEIIAPLALDRFGETRLEPSSLRRVCELVYAHYYALAEGNI